MKRQLRIITTSLLGILVSVVAISLALQEKPVVFRAPKSFGVPRFDCMHKPERPFKQIYGRRDIFGTYQTDKAKKKTSVSAIPQLTLPSVAPPPERPPADFIEPLNMKLNGIMLSSDESTSMCVMSDETDKDKTYHIGDQIQDGSIIKIGQRSVVILRANGQQETYLLSDQPSLFGDIKSLTKAIQQIDQNLFSVDPIKFKEHAGSLGELMEELDILPVFHEGKCRGMRIEAEEQGGLASVLGFQKKDIVLAVNNIPLTDKSERLSAYESVLASSYGGTILVSLERDGEQVDLAYRLEKAKTPVPSAMTSSEDDVPEGAPGAAPAVLSKDRFDPRASSKRTRRGREFKERHAKQYDENISAIRNRLLNNMKTRPNRVRVR